MQQMRKEELFHSIGDVERGSALLLKNAMQNFFF